MPQDKFTSQRFRSSFSHLANAEPKKVFALLCPVRERDWIPGWSAQIIFTRSGFAENNCVFQTGIPGRGKSTYVVTRYDKKPFRIEFAIFTPGMLVEKLDITVLPAPNNKSRLRWTRTYTGLSAKGNDWARNYIRGPFNRRMKELAKSMNLHLAGKSCS